jgi:hypothetical protein
MQMDAMDSMLMQDGLMRAQLYDQENWSYDQEYWSLTLG